MATSSRSPKYAAASAVLHLLLLGVLLHQRASWIAPIRLPGNERGTKGDVILDIVIDPTGKIADIKMTSGLGHGIDETIIATVQQWTFRPATRDGQPVASEQELHFHYEKA